VLIGSRQSDPLGRTNAGITYVVYGKTGGYPSPIDLATLTSSEGSVIYGAAANDRSDISVSPAGDFNNDGIDDVLICAREASPLLVRTKAEAPMLFMEKPERLFLPLTWLHLLQVMVLLSMVLLIMTEVVLLLIQFETSITMILLI
jgi:hypothetical protein